MHVDWGWIKQRPHFLAEELSRHHCIRVLYKPMLFCKKQLTKSKTSLDISPLLPLPWRFKSTRRIAAWLQKLWISRFLKQLQPNIIWVTHPTLVDYLPADARRRCSIVYDCMDDALGFNHSLLQREDLARLEADLVNSAAKVLCSSEHLCRLLIARYGAGVIDKLTLVRNGLSAELLKSKTEYPMASHIARRSPEVRARVAYIGTIADWFDFEAVMNCLKNNESIEFHLIGPVAVKSAPRHPRLRYHGPVDHDGLAQYVQQFDAFVMPFRVTPLIESVDPVKLYEYLAFGKEVISIRYEEIERFTEMVHFYDEGPDLSRVLHGVINGILPRKNVHEKTVRFLSKNSWTSRAEELEPVFLDLSE